MAKRYQRHKVAGRLVLGGYGQRYAKLAAERIQNMADISKDFIDPTEWKNDTPVLWTQGSAKGKAMFETISKYQEKSIVQVNDKAKSLIEALKTNKWTGAMAKLDQGESVDASWTGLPGTCSYAHDLGACPWLVSLQRHVWRCGPNAYPLPGIGGFACLHGAEAVVLQLLPIEPLVECGLVALADVVKFLETDSGIDLATKHCIMLPRASGDVVWVPHGYMCIPSFVPDEQAREPKEISDTAFIWHLSIYNEDISKQVSAKAWAVLKTYNDLHFNKMSSAPVWQARKDLWSKFLAEYRS